MSYDVEKGNQDADMGDLRSPLRRETFIGPVGEPRPPSLPRSGTERSFAGRRSFSPEARTDASKSLPEDFEEVDDQELGTWLVDQFKDDVFKKYIDADRRKKDGRPTLKISLAGLHRMKMRKLQVQLTKQILHMRYYKKELKGWEDLLDQYIQASRDYDYIRDCVDRDLDDPFLVLTDKLVDAQVLRLSLDSINEDMRKVDGLESIELGNNGLVSSFASPKEKIPRPIGGLRGELTQKRKTELFLTRLAFAIIGGIFLIAPMWLMVLHNTRATVLSTTSISVLLWAIAAAWKLEGGPLSVLSTTAAYAAVLVVFVGTNT